MRIQCDHEHIFAHNLGSSSIRQHLHTMSVLIQREYIEYYERNFIHKFDAVVTSRMC
jgi:hypothetical protein